MDCGHLVLSARRPTSIETRLTLILVPWTGTLLEVGRSSRAHSRVELRPETRRKDARQSPFGDRCRASGARCT